MVVTPPPEQALAPPASPPPATAANADVLFSLDELADGDDELRAEVAVQSARMPSLAAVEAAMAANDKAVLALQELSEGIQEAREETRGLLTWLRNHHARGREAAPQKPRRWGRLGSTPANPSGVDASVISTATPLLARSLFRLPDSADGGTLLAARLAMPAVQAGAKWRDMAMPGVTEGRAWAPLEEQALRVAVQEGLQQALWQNAFTRWRNGTISQDEWNRQQAHMKVADVFDLTGPTDTAALDWAEVSRRVAVLVARQQKKRKAAAAAADDAAAGAEAEPTAADRRSAVECRLWWDNSVGNHLAHGAWSAPEEKRLIELVKAHTGVGPPDWQRIAEHVRVAAGSAKPRSAIACLNRYQRALNPTLIGSSWSTEEDKRLRDVVFRNVGAGMKHNWSGISKQMPKRTVGQVLHRWEKALVPGIRKGTWSMEEDVEVLTWAEGFIKNKTSKEIHWTEMAQEIPYRTDVQVRERWSNILDPSRTHGDWSRQEDEALRRAVAQFGARWGAVANLLKPRTDNQCWRRYNVSLVHRHRHRRIGCVRSLEKGRVERREGLTLTTSGVGLWRVQTLEPAAAGTMKKNAALAKVQPITAANPLDRPLLAPSDLVALHQLELPKRKTPWETPHVGAGGGVSGRKGKRRKLAAVVEEEETDESDIAEQAFFSTQRATRRRLRNVVENHGEQEEQQQQRATAMQEDGDSDGPAATDRLAEGSTIARPAAAAASPPVSRGRPHNAELARRKDMGKEGASNSTAKFPDAYDAAADHTAADDDTDTSPNPAAAAVPKTRRRPSNAELVRRKAVEEEGGHDAAAAVPKRKRVRPNKGEGDAGVNDAAATARQRTEVTDVDTAETTTTAAHPPEGEPPAARGGRQRKPSRKLRGED